MSLNINQAVTNPTGYIKGLVYVKLLLVGAVIGNWIDRKLIPYTSAFGWAIGLIIGFTIAMSLP